MTPESADHLRRRLRDTGLSRSAIRAAWPRWWSQEADSSASARLELRFALARNLGLEPHSLIEGEAKPKFVWRGQARFKRLTAETDVERDAVASFGRALGAILLAAAPEGGTPLIDSATTVRSSILASGASPYVGLVDLLSLCWGLGIPVAYLRIFPGEHKQMVAMTVFVADRPVILLAKDSKFPGQLAFYLGHELGHIALGHVPAGAVLVDMEQDMAARDADDDEERAADAFALEVLTGEASPKVVSGTGHASGAELARVAIDGASELGIEAGTLALCFGYSTGRWGTAMRAMNRIYPSAQPLWPSVNQLATRQLDIERLPTDSRDYLLAALGFEQT